MKKNKPTSVHSSRNKVSKRHVQGVRHNASAGSRHVKTIKGKIPKTPSEKIDPETE